MTAIFSRACALHKTLSIFQIFLPNILDATKVFKVFYSVRINSLSRPKQEERRCSTRDLLARINFFHFHFFCLRKLFFISIFDVNRVFVWVCKYFHVTTEFDFPRRKCKLCKRCEIFLSDETFLPRQTNFEFFIFTPNKISKVWKFGSLYLLNIFNRLNKFK